LRPEGFRGVYAVVVLWKASPLVVWVVALWKFKSEKGIEISEIRYQRSGNKKKTNAEVTEDAEFAEKRAS